jgi:AcrR family transcriptional regulator
MVAARPGQDDPTAWEDSSVLASPAPISSSLIVKPSAPGTYDRSKSRKERRDDQRRRILLGAAHVFACDGYAGASVATILECSGVSRGTFYRHFSDLADVFFAVRQEAARLLFEEVERSVLGEAHPVGRLRLGVRTFLSLVAKNADLARVFLRESPSNRPRHREVRKRALERFVVLMNDGLKEAVAQGLVPRMPDELTVYALVVAFEGIAARYLEAREEARVLEAEPVMFDLCVRAFR